MLQKRPNEVLHIFEVLAINSGPKPVGPVPEVLVFFNLWFILVLRI